MQKKFTKEFMLINKGCYSEEQLLQTSFMKNKSITLNQILKSEISLKDKYWFVCKKLATKEQNQLLAISCAEIVLEIYENKYPENKAPRESIQAAKDYLNDEITIEILREKRKAASAAAASASAATYADAAYAADAASTAAAAASAADATYDDAAYATHAVAAAAYAVAAYTAKKDLNNLLLQNLINFCKTN